jgi:hypothetical protein
MTTLTENDEKVLISIVFMAKAFASDIRRFVGVQVFIALTVKSNHLGCEASSSPTFRRNILPPYSGSQSK